MYLQYTHFYSCLMYSKVGYMAAMATLLLSLSKLLVPLEGVIVKPGLWTMDWTGPWTGLWTVIWTVSREPQDVQMSHKKC